MDHHEIELQESLAGAILQSYDDQHLLDLPIATVKRLVRTAMLRLDKAVEKDQTNGNARSADDKRDKSSHK